MVKFHCSIYQVFLTNYIWKSVAYQRKKKCLKHFSEPYRDAFTITMTVNKQITTGFAKIQYFQTKMSR